MLGSTHSRIALKIAEELGIKERPIQELLVNGSCAPDSWYNFPHHQGKEHEIEENIRSARRLFLQNDDECYYRLGVALHYIEDRWTLKPRISDKHTEWEKYIDESPIVDDAKLRQMMKETSLPSKELKNYEDFLREIKKGLFGTYSERMHEIKETINQNQDSLLDLLAKTPANTEFSHYVISYALQERPSAWSSPLLDLNFAYRISFEIAKAVLTIPPKKMANAIEIEQKVMEFPDSYFRHDWSQTHRARAFTKLADVVDLRSIGNRWNDASILTFNYHDLTMEKVVIPEKVKKRILIKKPHWLFKNKEIQKEETVEDTQRKTIFRVYLDLAGRTYADCASKDVALYVLEALRSIAINPNSDVRMRARNYNWIYTEKTIMPVLSLGDDGTKGRGYIRWCDLVNFPIPNKTYLRKLLKEYNADKTALEKLKKDPLTWF
jgi:hypothetical protein